MLLLRRCDAAKLLLPPWSCNYFICNIKQCLALEKQCLLNRAHLLHYDLGNVTKKDKRTYIYIYCAVKCILVKDKLTLMLMLPFRQIVQLYRIRAAWGFILSSTNYRTIQWVWNSSNQCLFIHLPRHDHSFPECVCVYVWGGWGVLSPMMLIMTMTTAMEAVDIDFPHDVTHFFVNHQLVAHRPQTQFRLFRCDSFL